jgi:hypothetical protein
LRVKRNAAGLRNMQIAWKQREVIQPKWRRFEIC